MSDPRHQALANSRSINPFTHLNLVSLLLQMLGFVLLLSQNTTQGATLVKHQLLRSIIHLFQLVQVKFQFREMLCFEVDLRHRQRKQGQREGEGEESEDKRKYACAHR